MAKYTLVLFFVFLSSCSNTRWAVVDLEAVNSRDESVVTDVKYSIVAEQMPDHQDPFFTIAVKQVNEVEVPQRVLMERTIQRYRPKPFFTLLSSLGAGVAFYAANSNSLAGNLSDSQSLAFNAAGALFATLAFTNLDPVGEPIMTGEQKYLRQSGTVTGTDTVSVDEERAFRVDLVVRHEGEEIYNLNDQIVQKDGFSLNVASLLQNRDLKGPDPGVIAVTVRLLDSESSYRFPVSSFMTPVIHIDSPVAQLRSEPVFNSGSLFSEVANGSELMFLDEEGTQWYEVLFGGTGVYVSSEDGEIRWNPVRNGNSPSVITVTDVPFGDLNVENSIPVLRRNNLADAGFIISNENNNQVGQRSYLDRDLRMMDLYFRNALNIPADRVLNIPLTTTDIPEELFDTVSTDSSATLFVYIAGFATVTEDSAGAPVIRMVHLDEENNRTDINLGDLLAQIARKPQQQMVIFTDLEFQHLYNEVNARQSRDQGTTAFLRIANSVLTIQPNTALVFSSRTDQSSGVYVSERFENRYHHIFPYYIAQGLQQRRTEINELVRYLENQVDYTSRLLYDRAQEVQSFGNLTIDLAN